MHEVPFTKENVDGYLKELAKEYRKMIGSYVPAELILIGGAAVLINYGFREMSRVFIESVYEAENLSALYKQIREDEKQNKDILLEFQDDYPDVLNGDNLADVLKAARAKKSKNN